MPIKYEISPKTPAAIITGPMANPSSPSVKLTAFDEPTMTRVAKMMKNQPRSIITVLRKGTVRPVARGVGISCMIHRLAITAMAISRRNLSFPGRPLALRLETFR